MFLSLHPQTFPVIMLWLHIFIERWIFPCSFPGMYIIRTSARNLHILIVYDLPLCMLVQRFNSVLCEHPIITDVCSEGLVASLFPLFYKDVQCNTRSDAVEKDIYCPVASKWTGWMQNLEKQFQVTRTYFFPVVFVYFFRCSFFVCLLVCLQIQIMIYFMFFSCTF